MCVHLITKLTCRSLKWSTECGRSEYKVFCIGGSLLEKKRGNLQQDTTSIWSGVVIIQSDPHNITVTFCFMTRLCVVSLLITPIHFVCFWRIHGRWFPTHFSGDATLVRVSYLSDTWIICMLYTFTYWSSCLSSNVSYALQKPKFEV